MIDEILGKKNIKIIYTLLDRKCNGIERKRKELNEFYEYYNINRTQKSVFEGFITESMLKKIQIELGKLINS